MESEDDRIKFIVHVGDSFYCVGVGEMTTIVGHSSGRTFTVTKSDPMSICVNAVSGDPYMSGVRSTSGL